MPQFIPKEEPKPSLGLDILLVFSLLLLIAAIAGYVVFYKLIADGKLVLEDLNRRITQENTAERVALKTEMIEMKRKIDDFGYLVNQHLKIDQVFEIIQTNTHPQVWFTQFELDPRSRIVKLIGETQSFATVGQQVSFFQKVDKINQVNLDEVSLTKEGKISFKLSLSFKPEVFNF